MINFSKMGKLVYATDYSFDINDNKIKTCQNIITDTELLQNAIVNTVVVGSNNYIINKNFSNTVELLDHNNKCYKFTFDTPYLMRLDVLIDYIERYYRAHVLKESTPLDRVTFTYDKARNKTENEFKAYIGYIHDNRSCTIDISIDVDKANAAVRTYREMVIREYEKHDNMIIYGKELDWFILSKHGYFNLKPQTDKTIGYSNYFDKEGLFHSLVYTYYEDTVKDKRLNIIPNFYCCYSNIDFDTKEYLDIEYDEFGIYKSNSNMNKFPCIYEKEKIGKDEFAIYSLHPLHLDHNNFYLEYDDHLYVMDRLEYVDQGFGEYKVVREVRRLSDKEIEEIREASNNSSSKSKLVNLTDIDILASVIKLTTHI